MAARRLSQRIVVDGIRPDRMKLQIEEVLNQMRQYHDAMVDALAVEIPDAKVRRPEGGYFWAELPAGILAKKLVERGIARGVEVSPRSCPLFDSDPGVFLLYAYSYVGVDDIRGGVRRLGKAYREVVVG